MADVAGRAGALPDFLVVGPGRSGTTWLYRRLYEHPGVCLAEGVKEVNFFNRYFDRGLDWYAGLFEGCAPDRTRGEVSNLYFYDAEVPERVRSALPDAKILVTLRDPYERLCSVYRYWKGREKLDRGTTLGDVIADPTHPVVRMNCYGTLLERWYGAMPAEQIHVALFDHLLSDPDRYLEEVAEFLEIDAGAMEATADSGSNRAIQARLPGIGRLARRTGELLRGSGLRGLLGWLKRSSLVQRLLFTEPSTSSRELLTGEVVDALRPVLNPEIERAEEASGRTLARWKR